MRRRLFLAAVLFILGCAGDPRWKSLDRREEAAAEARKLHRMFDEYFEEYLELFPTVATSIGDHRYDDRLGIAIGEEHRRKQRDLYCKYLGALESILKDRLEREDRLNHAVFERLLTQRLEALRFEQHLQPVRQIQSMAVEFPLLGSGRGAHPFKRVSDYENFLRRIERFQHWVDTAIGNMRRGVARGIVPSRVVIERTLPQIEAMIVDDPKQSLFFRPVLEMPDHFDEAEKTRLTHAYSRAVEERIVAAYRKLRDFLRDEYLAKTRATTGMSGLPEGNAWYDHLVKTRTTTNLTPEEIFELGVSEIARINRERERMRAESGFQGTLRDFAQHLRKNSPFGFRTKEELLEGYEAIRARVTPLLPNLFGRLPNAPYEIRTVEEFRENSSPSQYHAASPDGSRPGIFYLNARAIAESPRRPSESLFLHEAVPGHHFQISLQRERSALPRFRRFSSYTAFVEGWALYAESLGRELGLYTEPEQHFSRLNSELFRAVRLVVDVGLHRKGWTRDQALKFMMETTSASESGAALEIDRYIALPGQALAYKIGQLKISAIRAKAEKVLGPKFDIRAFHDELLKDGALPLDLLEAKMDVWLEDQAR
jgi:uncharacterized protein (DUF885 family)